MYLRPESSSSSTISDGVTTVCRRHGLSTGGDRALLAAVARRPIEQYLSMSRRHLPYEILDRSTVHDAEV